ncbi:MAG: hypothetical protein Q4C12_01455 [Clostridia bacterium]|nr:hypothetical protein [Clostridia bacterium]
MGSSKKKNVVLYIILRLFVLAIMVVQLLHGNYSNVFLCLLTLILFMIPVIIDRKFNIELPGTLEMIIVLFIFSAEILGEIQNFYNIIPYWDMILHTINGFIMAAIGLALIDILNQNPNTHINLSPVFIVLVGFCFSMTIGVLWEFFEFGMDSVFRTDMQKDTIITSISSVEIDAARDNNAVKIDSIKSTRIMSDGGATVIDGGYLDIGLTDTMQDLLVNFLGAVLFSCLGLFYIKNRGKGSFLKRFIPRKRKSNARLEK